MTVNKKYELAFQGIINGAMVQQLFRLKVEKYSSEKMEQKWTFNSHNQINPRPFLQVKQINTSNLGSHIYSTIMQCTWRL